MPYKRKYRTTARGRSTRGSAMSRYPSKQQREKTIQKVINRSIETKTQYTDIDEVTVNQYGEAGLTPFNLVAHGNQGNQRIGQRIDPVSLDLKMYFRPRSLLNPGGNAGDPEEQFDSAFFSRIVIVRQKPGLKFTAGTPVQIPTTSSQLLVGNAGTVQALNGDYRDLLRKFNPKFFNVIYDKKIYVPMQYKMLNTKEVNFHYRFPKSVKQTYSDNSEYSDEPLFMFIVNRFADDDTHATNKSIEYSGEAVFKFKDA